MGVHHIVLFQFRAGASAEAVAETCARMMALKDACTHPETGKPYIRSLRGGKDMSTEGLQSGITHAFVVEFESVADRDLYVGADEAHRAFVQAYVAAPGAAVEKAMVVDFEPGVFA